MGELGHRTKTMTKFLMTRRNVGPKFCLNGCHRQRLNRIDYKRIGEVQ